MKAYEMGGWKYIAALLGTGALGTLIGLGCNGDTASPRDYILVSADGSGDYVCIQDAIDAAQSQDEIVLRAGVYSGDGNRDMVLAGKSITFRSEEERATDVLVVCDGDSLAPHRAMTISSGAPEWRYVTFSGGYAARDIGGGAILCEGGTPKFHGCIFADCATSGSGGAIRCNADARAAFEYCTFVRNSAGIAGGAIYAVEAYVANTSCSFAQNGCDDRRLGGCITAVMSDGLSLQNCILSATLSGAAVVVDVPTFVTIACTDIHGSDNGDWIGHLEGYYGLNGNIAKDPRFCNENSPELYLGVHSPCSADSSECGLMGAWPVECDLTP